MVRAVEAESPGVSGIDHFSVQSKLAVLSGELHRAEQLLLQQARATTTATTATSRATATTSSTCSAGPQGLLEEAMEMYQELHKWEESIQVAETKQHPEVATLKANYFQWLAETGQEEKAAESKEREGDLVTAIHLYLKGGLPARAAAVVTRYEGRTSFQPALLETVANALHSSSMFERAGAFYEQLNDPSRAMDCYRKGQAYGRAVELSRRCFQGREVVELEQLWGDHLVSLKKSDEAIAHFVEAGAALKAVEAAIQCRQWAKAAQVVETLDPTEARPYYQQIAKYYEGARNYDDAERFYLRAGLPQDVVEMYSKANKWGTPRDASRTGRLTHTQHLSLLPSRRRSRGMLYST